MRGAWWWLVLGSCLACTRDLGIEERLYHCSSTSGCGPGFVCDLARRICVRDGDQPLLDGGSPDAIAADAELPDSSDRPGPWCGNGIQEAQETCDDGNTQRGDGCEGCELQPLLRRRLTGIPGLQAIAAGPDRVYATGTQGQTPLLLVFDELGVELARSPVTCLGRNRGYLYGLSLAGGDILATGHLYGVEDLQGEFVVRTARAMVRFNAEGQVLGCHLAPAEPTEATGRFLVPLPGGGALVGGNFTRSAFDPLAEDSWLTRIDGPGLTATATAARVVGLRLSAASLGGDGSVYAVGRKGPWTAPVAIVLVGDPRLDDLRATQLPGLGSLSAVAVRPGGAWLFGQTADGRPFVVPASTSSVGAPRALALSPWISVEVLAARALADGRVVIAGRRTDFNGTPSYSASFWALLDTRGEVQKEVVLDVPEAIDQFVALSVDDQDRIWFAGTRNGFGVIERWAVD